MQPELLELDPDVLGGEADPESEAEAARLAAWLDVTYFGEKPRFYFFAPEREAKGRIAVGLDVGYLRPTEVTVNDDAREALGVESVEEGSEIVLGFGARGDYRFGRSGPLGPGRTGSDPDGLSPRDIG